MKIIAYALVIVLFSAVVVLISFSRGAINTITDQELGKGYTFGEEGGAPLIYKDYPKRKFIPASVEFYKYDENFIVARQKEFKSNKDINNNGYKSGISMNTSDSMNYWIIILSSDSILGPLGEAQYIKKCKELNVPKDIMSIF